MHLKHSLIPQYEWRVSLIYCSDPGLFVYCCDFSTAAVDLVQVISVVTYKDVGSIWGQLPINTNLYQLPVTLWLCWQLSGFSPGADPCTGKSGKWAGVEIREVKVLKMSHWQQTSQTDFLPLWLAVLFSIQCSFSWVTWKKLKPWKHSDYFLTGT